MLNYGYLTVVATVFPFLALVRIGVGFYSGSKFTYVWGFLYARACLYFVILSEGCGAGQLEITAVAPLLWCAMAMCFYIGKQGTYIRRFSCACIRGFFYLVSEGCGA